MKIFIGSSKEYKYFVEKLSQFLRSCNYTVLPWYELFPAGSITIDTLTEEISKCDTAIFILDSSYKCSIPSKKPHSRKHTTWFHTSLNVILEIGIAIATLGREKVLILRENESFIPSDLEGITYISIAMNQGQLNESIKERISKELRRILKIPERKITLPKENDFVIAYVSDHEFTIFDKNSPVIQNKPSNRIPFAFKGPLSAYSWSCVESSISYRKSRKYKELAEGIFDFFKEDFPTVRSIITIGAGIGSIEKEIISTISLKLDSLPHIVNIDINPYLCITALKNISKGTEIPKLLGVITDVEDIKVDTLRKIFQVLPSPKLIILLGGTISNLSNPLTFLEKLIRATKDDKDTYIIADFFTYKEEYSEDKDVFYNIEELFKDFPEIKNWFHSILLEYCYQELAWNITIDNCNKDILNYFHENCCEKFINNKNFSKIFGVKLKKTEWGMLLEYKLENETIFRIHRFRKDKIETKIRNIAQSANFKIDLKPIKLKKNNLERTILFLYPQKSQQEESKKEQEQVPKNQRVNDTSPIKGTIIENNSKEKDK